MILLETHAHSKPASTCAHILPCETISLSKGMGYDALVITNHFGYSPDIDFNVILDETISDYEACVSAGRELGVKVFFGLELRFAPLANDYLAYGFTPKTIAKMGGGYASLEDFVSAKPPEVLIYQAHPFRKRMTLAEPRLLDGVETFNGNPRHESQNHLALEFALENNLLTISGSDLHQIGDEGRGGVYLPRMPKDEADLTSLLRLVTPGDHKNLASDRGE